MAEREEGAFELLGRIIVDTAALRRSLGESEAEVKASSERLKKEWSEVGKHMSKVRMLPGGGQSEGGPGGEGPGGGGGEGGGRSGIAQFAHLARIIRHEVAPAIGALNPALGQFISAGSQAARTAVFFGAAIGGIAIAGAIVSSILAMYINKARETTQVQLDLSQAVKTLDGGRAEAEFKKASEGLAAFAFSIDQVTGKIDAGFLQKTIAYFDLGMAELTGKFQEDMNRLKRSVEANVAIFEASARPKAEAEQRAFNAGLLEREAQLNIKNARTVESLGEAYDKITESINKKRDAEIEALEAQLIAEAAAGKTGAVVLTGIAIDNKKAEAVRKLAENEDARMRALAAAKAEEESFIQKDVARERTRVESTINSEEAIAKLRREQHFLVEGEEQMEKRLAVLRATAAEAEQKTYESRKRSLEAQPDSIKRRQELEDLEKQHVADVEDLNRKAGEREAQEREARTQREFETRKSYADAYFRYQSDLGRTTWQEQLDSAKAILATTEEGTKRWFDAAQRVAGVYKGIHDEAKGIFTTMAGIAAEQASKAGRTRISVHDIPALLARARRQDERALGGASVSPGEIGQAAGRADFWKQLDRGGMTPAEAFRGLQADPMAAFQDAMGGAGRRMNSLSSSVEDLTGKFSGLGDAVDTLTQKIFGVGGGGVAQPTNPSILPTEMDPRSITPNSFSQDITASVNKAMGRMLQLDERRGPARTGSLLR